MNQATASTKVVLTDHAFNRIEERGLNPRDVTRAVLNAAPLLSEEGLRFKVSGLRLVAERHGNTLKVITCWQERKRAALPSTLRRQRKLRRAK